MQRCRVICIQLIVLIGDICDKGPGAIRIARQLIALKKKYQKSRFTYLFNNYFSIIYLEKNLIV